jgi:hypothetical protein
MLAWKESMLTTGRAFGIKERSTGLAREQVSEGLEASV